jgi:hypothetical protein
MYNIHLQVRNDRTGVSWTTRRITAKNETKNEKGKKEINTRWKESERKINGKT